MRTSLSKGLVALGLSLSVFNSTQVLAGDIEWNGFGSAYFAQSFDDDYYSEGYTDNEANFTSFSNFGLNVASQLSEEFSAAAQIVAEGDTANDSWNMNVVWGYVDYSPVKNLHIKGGRQLLPIIFANEFRNVGYLLPYFRIPSAALSFIPFRGFDGFTAAYSMGDFKVSAFIGNGNLDLPSNLTYKSGGVNNISGVTFDYDNNNGFGVHAMVARADTDLTVNTTVSGNSLDVAMVTNPVLASIGYRLDKWNLVHWAEFIHTESNDTTLRDASSGYALFGYRIGNWMPRYTFAASRINTAYRHSTLGLIYSLSQTTQHSFGFNYQLDPRAIFKVDYLYQTSGEPTSTGGTHARSLAVGVDFVF